MTVQPVGGDLEEWVYFGSASFKFPLSTFDTWINWKSVEIHQSMGAHDLAVIHARSRYLRWEETLYPGTPVTIKYQGKRTNSGKFYGYVTHVKPTSKIANDEYNLDIYCVASSRDLRDTGQNVWRNKSAPDIAREIAQKFKYKIITKQHPYRKPQTIQSGETYWEFLSRLAKTVGYILRVEGGTMFFLPYDDFLLAYATRAPRLSNTDVQTSSGEWLPRNVVTMHAWAGDTDTDVDRLSDDSIVTTLSPLGESASSVRRGPKSATRRRRRQAKYAKYRKSIVAHSVQDANILAESDAESAQAAIDAEGVVEGDGYLSPYRPVFVSLRDKSMNDWWLVKGVTHKVDITRGTYHCDITLSTDSVEPSLLPKVSQRRLRGLAQEAALGWSPSTLGEPRLIVTQSGFVRGQTRHNKTSARWVGL